MRVGSDNSIYSLFVPKAGKGPSVADEEIDMTPTQPPKAPPVQSDDELVAEFHSRMAKQALDWADTDKDGKVTESEFMDGESRLAEVNGRPSDAAYSENKWAKLDTTGKGWVNEDELGEGLEKIFPVSVGHFDAAWAAGMRTRQG
jgi:hypothetical protein